jgi:DNA-binding Xre family transcriptional regulator
MAVDYKRLWIKLAEMDISKATLREWCALSPATMTKLNKNSYVTLEVLERISRTLGCDIGDIVSVIPQSQADAVSYKDATETGIFNMKFVAFVGRFQDGRFALKKAVYLAGGAPGNRVRSFTDYIVVGEGGLKAKMYNDFKDEIEKGTITALKPAQLERILAGQESPPQHKLASASVRNINKETIWRRERDQFRAELAKAEPLIFREER